VTVPGLEEREAPLKKAPATAPGRGGRRPSRPNAKPPAKEVRLQVDQSLSPQKGLAK
jgi:hypothetical protein